MQKQVKEFASYAIEAAGIGDFLNVDYEILEKKDIMKYYSATLRNVETYFKIRYAKHTNICKCEY